MISRSYLVLLQNPFKLRSPVSHALPVVDANDLTQSAPWGIFVDFTCQPDEVSASYWLPVEQVAFPSWEYGIVTSMNLIYHCNYAVYPVL